MVVCVVEADGNPAAFARQLCRGNGLAVQHIAHHHVHGQFFIKISLVVDIVPLGIPDTGILPAHGIALVPFYVLNTGELGYVVDGVAAQSILNPIADNDFLDASVGTGQYVYSLVLHIPARVRIVRGTGLGSGGFRATVNRGGIRGSGIGGDTHSVHRAPDASQGQNCAQGKGHALHNGLFHFT